MAGDRAQGYSFPRANAAKGRLQQLRKHQKELHFKEPAEPPAETYKPGYRKIFLISAGAGAGFGLVTAVIFVKLELSPWPLPLFFPVMIIGVAVYSGLLGLGTTYLEDYLRRKGMSNHFQRLAISFGAAFLVSLAVACGATIIAGGAEISPAPYWYMLWGTLAGIAFGIIFALLNYRAEIIRQKIRILELENRRLAELASREELLREAARNLAVTEERNRMARELHDSITQDIHGILYSLRPLREVLAGHQQGMKILNHLEETAANALQELRRLVMELSPSPLEDQSLEEAFSLHCDLFARRTQMDLKLELDYNGTLQPDQEMAVYRITQEALANIQKYAEASRVVVSLQSKDDTTGLSITDNGKGFDPQTVKKGHGLANMADRARQSGGKLEIKSAPRQGTTIFLKFL